MGRAGVREAVRLRSVLPSAAAFPVGPYNDGMRDRSGRGCEVLPLHRDPHHTFRFADNRIIHRVHLEGVGAGVRVAVYRIRPETGERLGLLSTGVAGDGGWVDVAAPIVVRAGDAFVAVPEEGDT